MCTKTRTELSRKVMLIQSEPNPLGRGVDFQISLPLDLEDQIYEVEDV